MTYPWYMTNVQKMRTGMGFQMMCLSPSCLGVTGRLLLLSHGSSRGLQVPIRYIVYKHLDKLVLSIF